MYSLLKSDFQKIESNQLFQDSPKASITKAQTARGPVAKLPHHEKTLLSGSKSTIQEVQLKKPRKS